MVEKEGSFLDMAQYSDYLEAMEEEGQRQKRIRKTILCECTALTGQDILKQWQNFPQKQKKSPETLLMATGVGHGCGTCRQDMLAWLRLNMYQKDEQDSLTDKRPNIHDASD